MRSSYYFCLPLLAVFVVGIGSCNTLSCKASEETKTAKTADTKSATKDVALDKRDTEKKCKVKSIDGIQSIRYKNGKKLTKDDVCAKFIEKFERMSGVTATEEHKKEIQNVLSDKAIAAKMLAECMIEDVMYNAMTNDKEYMQSEETKKILASIIAGRQRNLLLNAFIMEKVGPSDINVDSSGKYKIFNSKECNYSDALSYIRDEYVKYYSTQNNMRKKVSYIVFLLEDKNIDSDKFKELCEPFNDTKGGFISKIFSFFKHKFKSKEKRKSEAIAEAKEYAKQYKGKQSNLITEDSIYLDDTLNRDMLLHSTVLDIFNNKLNKNPGVALTEIVIPGQNAESGKTTINLCICVSDVVDEKVVEFDKLDKKAFANFRSVIAANLIKDFNKQYVFKIINDDNTKVDIDFTNELGAVSAGQDKALQYAEKILINISEVKKLASDNNVKSLLETDEFKKLSDKVIIEYSVLGTTQTKTFKDILSDAGFYKNDAILKVMLSDEKRFADLVLICAQNSVVNDVTTRLFNASSDYNKKANSDSIIADAKYNLVTHYRKGIDSKARLAILENAKDEFGALDNKENMNKKIVTGVSLRAISVDDSAKQNITPIEYVNEKDKNISDSLAKDKNLSAVPLDSYGAVVYMNTNNKIAGLELSNVAKQDIGEQLWSDLISSGNPPKVYDKIVNLDHKVCSLIGSENNEFAGSRLVLYIEKYIEKTVADIIADRFEESRLDTIVGYMYEFVTHVNDISLADIDKRVIKYHLGRKSMHK